MRKKVLILGTVMTLAAGCLVGCGTNNNSVTDQSTASPSVEDDRNLNTKDPQYSPDGDDGVVVIWKTVSMMLWMGQKMPWMM